MRAGLERIADQAADVAGDAERFLPTDGDADTRARTLESLLRGGRVAAVSGVVDAALVALHPDGAFGATETVPAYNIDLRPYDVVNVDPKRTYTIYVYGQVTAPGSFQLDEPITLLQAVSIAGGLAERAAGSRVRILRKRLDGKQDVFEVDLEKIEDGEIADIPLAPGDVVLVPSTFF